jgi:tryptophan synthase alpha chain
MGRISDTLKRTQTQGRLALIAYVTCGPANSERILSVVEAVAKSGADMIEIGLPFADAAADGPTIRRANRRALDDGMTPERCLETVAEIRRRLSDVSLVLMSYAGALRDFGLDAYAGAAAGSGADGFIVVGQAPEEDAAMRASCEAAGLDFIPVVAPDYDDSRIAVAMNRASGFVYCRSTTAPTGAKRSLPAGLPDFLARVRRNTSLPLAVGFGVSRAEHLRSLHGMADAVVVGSAIVDIIDAAPPGEIEARVREYVRMLVRYREAGDRHP